MQLCETYSALGPESFEKLVRGISIGKLKTYQMYETFKVRSHLPKVNTELLRKAAPRFWTRITADSDEEFARELAQAVLVSHLDMIVAVLDFLGVPHENGFFSKDMDAKPYFTEGWEDRVFERFNAIFPESTLVFYINHLRWELLSAESPYTPPAINAA